MAAKVDLLSPGRKPESRPWSVRRQANSLFAEYAGGVTFRLSLSKSQVDLILFSDAVESSAQFVGTLYKDLRSAGTYAALLQKGLMLYNPNVAANKPVFVLTDEGKIVCDLLKRAGLSIAMNGSGRKAA